MRRRAQKLASFWTVFATLSLFFCSPAGAEVEGFESRQSDNFRFLFRPRYLPVVGDTIEIAEDARRQIINDLGAPEGPVIEVRFARNVEEMRSLSPRRPPNWADAVAFSPENLIVISLTSNHHRPVSLETVFRHELSHIILRWTVGDRQIPRWFNEGIAIVESGELPIERLRLLWPGAARGELTPLRRLENRFPTREFDATRAYAESADFVRFLMRHRGAWRMRELLQRLRQGEDFYQALEATWGEPVRSLESAWHRDLRQRYSVAPTVTAGMTLWFAVGLMAIYAYVKRRRDIRRRIDALPDYRDEDDDVDESDVAAARS